MKLKLVGSNVSLAQALDALCAAINSQPHPGFTEVRKVGTVQPLGAVRALNSAFVQHPNGRWIQIGTNSASSTAVIVAEHRSFDPQLPVDSPENASPKTLTVGAATVLSQITIDLCVTDDLLSVSFLTPTANDAIFICALARPGPIGEVGRLHSICHGHQPPSQGAWYCGKTYDAAPGGSSLSLQSVPLVVPVGASAGMYAVGAGLSTSPFVLGCQAGPRVDYFGQSILFSYRSLTEVDTYVDQDGRSYEPIVLPGAPLGIAVAMDVI